MLIYGDYDNFTFNEDWYERLKTCMPKDTLLGKIGGEILESLILYFHLLPLLSFDLKHIECHALTQEISD